jgi:hypothetical protein
LGLKPKAQQELEKQQQPKPASLLRIHILLLTARMSDQSCVVQAFSKE